MSSLNNTGNEHRNKTRRTKKNQPKSNEETQSIYKQQIKRKSSNENVNVIKVCCNNKFINDIKILRKFVCTLPLRKQNGKTAREREERNKNQNIVVNYIRFMRDRDSVCRCFLLRSVCFLSNSRNSERARVCTCVPILSVSACVCVSYLFSICISRCLGPTLFVSVCI